MRFATGFRVIVAVSGLILAGSGWAAETVVDDFEGYASDVEVQAVWTAATANASTHVDPLAYDGVQALKIALHNGQDPWWTNVVMTLPVPMDLTDYARITLRFRGISGNSGEALVVQLKDEWGNWLDGAWVDRATQVLAYTEYAIDISGWAERTNFQTIEIHLPAQDYGASDFFIDRVVADTFPPIIDDFEGYGSDADLQPVCAGATANASTHVATPGDGGGQCMRIAYHNGQDPWWTNVIYTLPAPQNWTAYNQLTLRFKGEAGNSGEALIVQLKDEYGAWLDGPTVDRGTQVLDWTDYSIDISAWGGRLGVTKIEFHLPATDYGAGNLYIDKIELSENPATATDRTSWSGVKQLFR